MRLRICPGRTRSSSAAASSAPGVIERALAALPSGGRLVVNAVTLETQAACVGWRARFGGDLVQIAVAHAEPVGRFHRLARGDAGRAMAADETMTRLRRYRRRLPRRRSGDAIAALARRALAECEAPGRRAADVHARRQGGGAGADRGRPPHRRGADAVAARSAAGEARRILTPSSARPVALRRAQCRRGRGARRRGRRRPAARAASRGGRRHLRHRAFRARLGTNSRTCP